MLARGIRPAATLYHWELPQALADKGGWRNADMPHWFADFTETVMRRIGDRVWSAAPINEPWCVGWLSHFDGAHAPGLRDIRATARAMHHILVSHGRSIEVMRDLGMAIWVPCAISNGSRRPATPPRISPPPPATTRSTTVSSSVASSAVNTPPRCSGAGPHLPEGWQDDFAAIRAPLDWLGVNYYTRKIIQHRDGAWPNYAEAPTRLPLTQMGWEIYPEGLRDLLIRNATEYSGDLPIHVTENGMANPDTPDMPDTARIEYLERISMPCARLSPRGRRSPAIIAGA